MRQRLFIGSSVEQLEIAGALQENLEHKADVTLWNQRVFKPSQYPLDLLADAARVSDAGIFVLVPDDLTESRGASLRSVRDNVLFELGLFVGALGRHRTFIVVPRPRTDVHLPSDLAGLTPLDYDSQRKDGNWSAALGPAASKILSALADAPRTGPTVNLHVDRLAFFADFDQTFAEVIPRSRCLTLFFIHSRRWRETNDQHLRSFLLQREATLTVILPEPQDVVLQDVFARNFDDGPQIPTFIADACRYFFGLMKAYPDRVTVRFSRNYPTYSFYVLDGTAFMAMYPTTARKRPVPTMQVRIDSRVGQFVKDDLEHLLSTSRLATADDRQKLGVATSREGR